MLSLMPLAFAQDESLPMPPEETDPAPESTGAREVDADEDERDDADDRDDDLGERERGMRLYFGGGSAVAASGGAPGGVAALGVQSLTHGRRIGGAFGAELTAFQPPGIQAVIPVLNFDGGLRWTPFPEAPIVPYATGGLGLALLIVIPFPTVSLSLGAELPLGDLRLDAELHLRQVLPMYPGTEAVNIGTFRVGLGF